MIQQINDRSTHVEKCTYKLHAHNEFINIECAGYTCLSFVGPPKQNNIVL